MRRLLCRLLGCRFREWWQDCYRCGACYASDDWIFDCDAALAPLFDLIARFAWPRCKECKSLILWMRREGNPDFCSQYCEDTWIPF